MHAGVTRHHLGLRLSFMAMLEVAATPIVIADWFEQLAPQPLAEAAPDPARAAVFSADMVAGFCSSGALASERVGALAAPVTDLFRRAHEHGIRRFVLLQDAHHETTPEFQAFPPHCLAGTPEAETIPELASLPFAHLFTVIQKNSLHPAVGTGFDTWLDQQLDLRTAIVVGDCTDLCTYHLAMHLRLRANATDLQGFEVIVPADAVDTYDLPREVAAETGAPAHDGDFFHQVFLYHMALNGIRVVRALT